MDAKGPRKSESSLIKNRVQSRNKRSRNDLDFENLNKENVTNNTDRDCFIEKGIKKPRKEILSKTFMLSPTKCDSETTQQTTETQVLECFNFSPPIGSFPLMEKCQEEKSLRRETFIITPRHRKKFIKINENEGVNDVFSDSLSSPKRKLLSNFSLVIDNNNATPKISASADQVFEFSCRGSSTWTKPKKSISNDGILVTPQCKTDFVSCSREMPNRASKNRKEEILHGARSKQLSKSLKKKSSSVPGSRVAKRSLVGINRKKAASQPLKSLKKISNFNLHAPEDFNIQFVNPDPFAATTTEDPFLSSTLHQHQHHREKWIFLQDVEFKKWLNALMTAPEHLTTDIDSTSVDVGKVWQSCRMKEKVVLAESKESISARYHTNTRLNTLRKAAGVMFRKNQVQEALSGATHCIENGSLVIKKDKDPYRDIGLQKEILELFLSYNPLWLRIGLETVYEETIPLQSNNDLIGLTRFLLTRFFCDPVILKKNSHPTILGMKLPSFTSHMNNFVLTKFLQVVYFLDYAKTNRLIGHDPCLFRKNAPHKESRSILLAFSREVLGGIGDITKVLRLARYVVNYRQTYLDEFDYAVKDMNSDLRDGVRLCRTMELIRGKRNLTLHCRVPAISRLQRIHNVNIALTALLDSGYFLTGEIDAKSIVNGDREKTLSLLWQIIYKFQAPRFENAATRLQTWWRSKLWYVRIKNLLKKRRTDAASVIQKVWRCYSAKKTLSQLRVENEKNLELRNRAAWIIQEWWMFQREGVRERRKHLETKSAILKIQRWWKRNQETKPFVENLRRNIEAVILVQRIWRAKKLVYQKKLEYLKLGASRVIQKWWRRVLILKRDRNIFLLKKHAVWVFEKSWIERKIIVEKRKEFLKKRISAIVIQRSWRRYRETKNQVFHLRICRKSTLKIQSWWRSSIVRREYKIKRISCLKIQNWWRSLQEVKDCQDSFSRMKKAALIIQKNWRMMRAVRNYLQIKSAVLKIEFWFRMIEQKRTFENMLKKHRAAIVIQSRWRAYLEKKLEAVYIKNRKSAVSLQRWWRAIQLGRLRRADFLEAKEATVAIQKHWRGYAARKNYIKKREAAIQIQVWWREVLRKIQIEVERAMELKRTENAAMKIKAAWKDYKIRKTKYEMENLREKTEMTPRQAKQEETLAKRLHKSINTFLFSNDLGRLSMCLASLGKFK